jgi:membrane AbrB-like protein
LSAWIKPARTALGLAIAAAGGLLFSWIGTPIPWMLGSMFAMAIAQMRGAGFEPLRGSRDAGMVVIGITLGLYFTAPVVHEVASYWPWFIALGVAAHALGTVSALVLERLSGVDRATAYFGSMPGGASEMTQMAERFGAQPDKVAFAHSMRVVLVVTLFPVGITLGGFHASQAYVPVTVPFDFPGLLMLLAMGAVAGTIARKLGAPTAFMLGPLLLTIALTASGLQFSSMATPLVNVAQVLLGAVMGTRFEQGFLRAAPRFVAALVPSVAVTLGLAMLAGWALATTSGAYLGNGLLAAAPGGIAEMSITARVLKLGVAFVTAAHVVRYIIVVLLTIPVYRYWLGKPRAPDDHGPPAAP